MSLTTPSAVVSVIHLLRYFTRRKLSKCSNIKREIYKSKSPLKCLGQLKFSYESDTVLGDEEIMIVELPINVIHCCVCYDIL